MNTIDEFNKLFEAAYSTYNPDYIKGSKEYNQKQFINYYNKLVENEPYINKPLTPGTLSEMLKDGPKGCYSTICNLEHIAQISYIPNYDYDCSEKDIIKDILDSLSTIDAGLNRLTELAYAYTYGYDDDCVDDLLKSLNKTADSAILHLSNLCDKNDDEDINYGLSGAVVIIESITTKVEKIKRINSDINNYSHQFKYFDNKNIYISSLLDTKTKSSEELLYSRLLNFDQNLQKNISDYKNKNQIHLAESLLISMLKDYLNTK